MDQRLRDFIQIVRRDVRRHADGDAGRAVREQVGEARRHDRRHLVLLVVVGLEVDDVLIEVAQHLDRDRREPAFRITHGSEKSWAMRTIVSYTAVSPWG